jgi:protein involved in polysaccharide export with SLBB domain
VLSENIRMALYGPCSRLASIACTCGIAVSCSVTPPALVNEIYREVIDQRKNHYELKHGDIVSISFYNQVVDLNRSDATVLADGRTDLFFMGNMRLSGKTVEELESELEKRIAPQMRTTDISVQISPRADVVYLVGQFTNPGVVELKNHMTLQQAVSSASGLKVAGDTDWALLRRPHGNPRQPDLFRIDLNDLSEDIFLLPNDQVVLGRTFTALVIAYIQEFLSPLFPSQQTSVAAFGDF